MIIFIQYPLADLRSFVPSETGRLASPIWPTPIPDVEFVRNFGGIDLRSRGGVTGWVAESQICRSKNAIRFANQLRFERPYGHINLKVGGRHFYFDGMAVAKFEIVLVADPRDIESYPRPINDLLRQILECEIRFPKLKQDGIIPTARLDTAGKLLAQLYLASSTRKAQLDELEPKWVRHGEPLVLLETGVYEEPIIGTEHTDIAPLDQVVELKHWWLRGQRRTGVWLTHLLTYGVLPEQNLRTLRILLMRLHAEQQTLQYVLKAIAGGEISPASNGGKNLAGDRLQYYLSTACKRVFRMSKSAEGFIEPEHVAEVIRKSFDAVTPGQRDALLQKLEQYQIRPQVENYVGQVIQNYYNVQEAHVDQVTNINNSGQIIYADGQAQVSQVTMTQNVQAAIDLNKLSEELHGLLEQLRAQTDAAQHPEALESVAQAESSAKAGDHNKTLQYLKVAGKWVLDFAEKVGKDVAIAALKSAMGMGGA